MFDIGIKSIYEQEMAIRYRYVHTISIFGICINIQYIQYISPDWYLMTRLNETVAGVVRYYFEV